jgi:hypothetical protein
METSQEMVYCSCSCVLIIRMGYNSSVKVYQERLGTICSRYLSYPQRTLLPLLCSQRPSITKEEREREREREKVSSLHPQECSWFLNVIGRCDLAQTSAHALEHFDSPTLYTTGDQESTVRASKGDGTYVLQARRHGANVSELSTHVDARALWGARRQRT